MASFKATELGTRSPFIHRGGISFATWEGVNRQNDPGAIRDTQLYDAINVRINGNELTVRGGQEKIHDVAMDGCVYGFIDVPEGATSLILVANSDISISPPSARLDRYYTEASPMYGEVFAESQNLQGLLDDDSSKWNDSNLPRRSLTRFNGNLYQFGVNDEGPRLFKIVLPERNAPLTGINSFANQSKLEVAASIPEFSSACTRPEPLPDATIGDVLYVGSVSTGNVYRWDGQTVTVEDSNLPSDRHIMGVFREDVYAASTDSLRARNFGAWDQSFTTGTTNFVPCAMSDYQNTLFIIGQDTVLSFDGTTVTDVSAAFTAVTTDTPIILADVKPFNGLLWFLCQVGAISPLINIIKWDGSAFAHVATIGEDGPVWPGCMEPAGDKLFFTLKRPEEGEGPKLWYIDTSGAVVPQDIGPEDTSEEVMKDMVAF